MPSPIFYALLVSLLILVISAAVYGVYFFGNLLRHRKQKKEYDLESCTTPETTKREFESSTLARPPLAYFAMRSSKHITSIVRNIATFGPKPLTSLNDTAGSGTNTISRTNTAPLRPPRSTQSDDFLASFPYKHAMTSDVWFPIANQDTGRWDLCVVNATVTVACLGGYVAAAGVDSTPSQIRSIKAGERNTLKTKKTKRKRDGSKHKQDTLLPFLGIPELYVNARSYDDLEAEQTIITDSDVRSYLEEEYDTNFLFPTYGLSESI